MTEKYLYFDGVRFTRDDKTGYYLNSTLHMRMHKYVWEYYNGEVPKGYEVHHKDLDKSNNDISNLQLLTRSEHKKIHAQLLTDEQRSWRRNNMNTTARPKAVEWHKSDEGREWHRQQYEQMKDKLHVRSEHICLNCGKSFIGSRTAKYCCNNCKSAYRRKMGVDLVERTCVVCGKPFKTNKNGDVVTCSRSCTNKYVWRMRHESEVSEKNK